MNICSDRDCFHCALSIGGQRPSRKHKTKIVSTDRFAQGRTIQRSSVNPERRKDKLASEAVDIVTKLTVVFTIIEREHVWREMGVPDVFIFSVQGQELDDAVYNVFKRQRGLFRAGMEKGGGVTIIFDSLKKLPVLPSTDQCQFLNVQIVNNDKVKINTIHIDENIRKYAKALLREKSEIVTRFDVRNLIQNE